MEFVVPKLFANSSPDGVRHHLGSADVGAKVLGDGVVEPAKDALVRHGPFRVTVVVDVGGEERWDRSPNLPMKTSMKQRH